MRLIDADVLKEKIKNPDLTNHMKMALLSCVSSVPAVASLPNDPLTLDELREMDGEPVWIQSKYSGGWHILDYFGSSVVYMVGDVGYVIDNYGKTWLAYRRKPEEV